jgi:phage repressor protein C with HTH and peptisase S24 domain
MERHDRLRTARTQAGYERQRDVFEHHPDWNRNSYKSNENGNAPFSFETAKTYAKAFGVRAEWLYDGSGAMKAGEPDNMVPIVGRVGADNEGASFFASGQASPDFVPIPPGGSSRTVALDVVGHSMRPFVEDGGMLYFEDQKTPPTPDMRGHIVVVETEDGRVLVKRLARGSREGLWDLESLNGPTLSDVRLNWAAYITATIPPRTARLIAKRGGEAA